ARPTTAVSLAPWPPCPHARFFRRLALRHARLHGHSVLDHRHIPCGASLDGTCGLLSCLAFGLSWTLLGSLGLVPCCHCEVALATVAIRHTTVGRRSCGVSAV